MSRPVPARNPGVYAAFVSVLAGRGDAESLARGTRDTPVDRTLPSERDLVRNLHAS